LSTARAEIPLSHAPAGVDRGAGLLRAMSRYWHTTRYLRASQIRARIRLRTAAMLRRAWPITTAAIYRRRLERASLTLAPGGFGLTIPSSNDFLSPAAVEDSARLSASHHEGSFSYLNETHSFGRPMRWDAPDASRLWRYHLHYFDDLPVVALTAPAAASELAKEWVSANSEIGQLRDAWHPYVVSVRVVNWLLMAEVFRARGHELPDSIRRSLGLQLLFLERNLELDGDGNHLIRNLKALIFGACFFEGQTSVRWLEFALPRLCQEIDRQFLADGGHYERSPMYHCQATGDLLELSAVLAGSGRQLPRTLTDAAMRAVAYLDLVCHPDGDIALFNDSAFNMTFRARELRAFAAALQGLPPHDINPRHAMLSRLPHAPFRAYEPSVRDGETSGYTRLDSEPSSLGLIFDSGAVCPDDLPAHAHADLLSFEATIGGERFIVDSGVGAYEPGEWRDYWRSTRAHNTVSVDGMEQSDCWASFRVGRRARPGKTVSSETRDAVFVAASHDGFAVLDQPVIHRRTIGLVRGRLWIILDTLSGTGDHTWQSLLHFHPDVSVEQDGPSLRARTPRVHAVIAPFGELTTTTIVSGSTNPIAGWYADEFGKRRAAVQVSLAGAGTVPAAFGAIIAPYASVIRIRSFTGAAIALDVDAEHFEIAFPKEA
jgi:uncharacterized heparinase superfamily protein